MIYATNTSASATNVVVTTDNTGNPISAHSSSSVRSGAFGIPVITDTNLPPGSAWIVTYPGSGPPNPAAPSEGDMLKNRDPGVRQAAEVYPQVDLPTVRSILVQQYRNLDRLTTSIEDDAEREKLIEALFYLDESLKVLGTLHGQKKT